MSDLETILDIVANRLPKKGIECLLIGGFAVNYYGYTRNTLDVDFMVLPDQIEIVRESMRRAGFTNIAIQENVAFFSMPGKPLRVDFLQTSKSTMQKLLVHSKLATVGGREVRVPSLGDLIAMKIFSLSRDLARRMGKDLPDIAYLCVLHNLDMESDVRPLCDEFGTGECYQMIKTHVEALRTA